MTTGDHAFKKRDIFNIIDTLDIARPLNYGDLAKGRGYIIKEKEGKKVCVVNLLGRVFMQPVDCPFKAVSKVLEEALSQTKIVLVDMHAEATSEKLAMGNFLAQKASAVVGTHTHIPTADERILEGFTAYITDVGMTGSFDSILGRRKEDIIEKFLTNIPCRFNLADSDVRMQGVLLEIDESTGKALSIKRVEYKQEA
jgi:metallophosphoesterase (TIGR00282 family)